MGERLDVEESGFIGSITLRSSGSFGLFFLISNLIQLSFYFFQIPSSRMYLWTVTVAGAYVLGSTNINKIKCFIHLVPQIQI
jgi:hypothetical protein